MSLLPHLPTRVTLMKPAICSQNSTRRGRTETAHATPQYPSLWDLSGERFCSIPDAIDTTRSPNNTGALASPTMLPQSDAASFDGAAIRPRMSMDEKTLSSTLADDKLLKELGYVPSFKREFSNLATVRLQKRNSI